MTVINALFAASGEPLNKSFTFDGTKLSVESYPHIRDFNSVTLDVRGINQLADAVVAVGDKGGCLLKGLLDTDPRSFPRCLICHPVQQ
jgi:hypothetical protein